MGGDRKGFCACFVVAGPRRSGIDRVVTKPSNTRYKVAQRELSLPEIANELSNVSRARDMIGYSRQQCYGIRWNFQAYGADGLIDRLPGLKDIHPNCVAAEIDTAILEHAFAQGARICVFDRLREIWA
jgi:hypothetical protein